MTFHHQAPHIGVKVVIAAMMPLTLAASVSLIAEVAALIATAAAASASLIAAVVGAAAVVIGAVAVGVAVLVRCNPWPASRRPPSGGCNNYLRTY